MTHVKWWEYINGKPRVIGYICFSKLGCFGNADKIVYLAKINYTLSLEKADKYVEFLKQAFPEVAFKASKAFKVASKKDILGHSSYKVNVTGSGKYVRFEFDSKDMTNSCKLMFLTAFRYLDEFPDIVNDTIDKEFNQAFIAWQKVSGSAHALVGSSYSSINRSCSNAPITRERFWENIKNNLIPSVYGFFS